MNLNVTLSQELYPGGLYEVDDILCRKVFRRKILMHEPENKERDLPFGNSVQFSQFDLNVSCLYLRSMFRIAYSKTAS
jgi:hypothetical protein